MLRASVDTDDDAIAWGERQFRRYRSAARPVERPYG